MGSWGLNEYLQILIQFCFIFEKGTNFRLKLQKLSSQNQTTSDIKFI